MATKREKYLIGGLLVALGVGGVGLGLIMPTFEAIMTKMGQVQQAEDLVVTQEAQVHQLNQQIRDLKRLKELPEGLVVREYSPDTLQENIKIMIDQIVRLSTTSGNELIALEPWAAPPLVQPSDPEPEGKGKTGAGEQQVPEKPPAPSLQSFGYALTVRGNYDNIVNFLGALDSHSELIEVNSIDIENESGEDRSTAPAGPTNPFKPIRLRANMILFLQPKL